MSGLLLLASVCVGCKTTPSLEPYYGEPVFTSEARLNEYELLKQRDQERAKQELEPETQKLRAWIREADRVIRANNALRED